MATPRDPTPDQIAIVQSNLKNMQAFNDQVYNFGLSKYLNAFALLSEQDNDDLGLQIGLNVVEGAFWAAGAVEGGPAGSFLASFASGMVAYWLTNTPPSLNGAFAQNVVRFQKTTEAVDTQLATFYADVAGNWNQSYTYNGKTGTLSDLAGFNFPAETDPAWTPMLNAALTGVDQALWTALLNSYCVVTFWYVSGDGTWNGASLFTEDQDQNSPPVDWAQAYYKKNPAYYETWTWYSADGKNCCGPPSCWAVSEYNIGTGVGPLGLTDGSISADACNYLFIDSTSGEVINSDGLFTREDVFTKLGITQKTFYVSNVTPPAGARLDNVSVDFLRAIKEQQTLGQLIWREGRREIERRLVREAQRDPVFAHNLVMRPRMTAEQFLGIKIPEVIAVHVLQELPWSLAIVLPVRSWAQLNAFSTADPSPAAQTHSESVSSAPATETVEQFFNNAPQAAAGSADNVTAVYQVLLSGQGGGDWVLRVQNGKVAVEKGQVDKPDVTLRAAASDWADMASGKLDALLAFFIGKLSVDGDLLLARKLRDIFPPSSR